MIDQPKYKKAKAWMGKDLSLHVNNGDRKVHDADVLTGPEWEKFVGMGFLVRVTDEKKKIATAAPAAPAPSQAGTRSPASKVQASIEATRGASAKEADERAAAAEAEKAAEAERKAAEKAAKKAADEERKAAEKAAKKAAEAEKKAAEAKVDEKPAAPAEEPAPAKAEGSEPAAQ